MPPNVPNARRFGNDFTYKSKITYQCNDGYYVSRTETAVDVVCTDTSLWIPDPETIICQGTAVKCYAITHSANHLVLTDKRDFVCDPPLTLPEFTYYYTDSYAYLTTFNVSCYSGYWLEPGVTERSIQCQFDGSWMPDPTTFICKGMGIGIYFIVRELKYKYVKPI